MILESVVIVGFALLLDFFIGDPKTKYHPTAWMGKLIALLVPFTKSNSAKKELIGGVLIVGIIVATVCTVLVVLDIGISLLTRHCLINSINSREFNLTKNNYCY